MRMCRDTKLSPEQTAVLSNALTAAKDCSILGYDVDQITDADNETTRRIRDSLLLIGADEYLDYIRGFEYSDMTPNGYEFHVENEHFPDGVYFETVAYDDEVFFCAYTRDGRIQVACLKEAIEKHWLNDHKKLRSEKERTTRYGDISQDIVDAFKEKDEAAEEAFEQQRVERGWADSDVWNMCDWFIDTIRPMLQHLRKTHTGSPSYLGTNYENEEGILVNDTCHDEWNEILDRMIFLLGEMREDTCSQKNPYEEDVMSAYDRFHEKYGFFGDGLKTKGEKAAEEERGSYRMYFPSDEPGRDDIRELFDKYHAEEKKLHDYRNACKDEFFVLFSKHFYALWD